LGKTKLPKSILKNWVYIPKTDVKSEGYWGNDSVNFRGIERIIKTDAFYSYNKEVTNQDYHEFLTSTKNPLMLPDTNSWTTDFKVSYLEPMKN